MNCWTAVDIVSVASPAMTHAGPGARRARRPASRSMWKSRSRRRIEDADRLIGERSAGRAWCSPAGTWSGWCSTPWACSTFPSRRAVLEAVRKGPWSPRNTDVSCVLDLMIHDIDLAWR